MLHRYSAALICGFAVAIVAAPAHAVNVKVLHKFGGQREGLAPEASPIIVGGKLYGTTPGGGGSGLGTIYSLDLTTGTTKVAYTFRGGSDGSHPQGSLIDVGGMLYGTTAGGGGSAACSSGCGTLFAFNPNTGSVTVIYAFQGGADGAYPQAGLIKLGGTLYGTTLVGGPTNCISNYGNSCGTVFSLDLKTGLEKVVYAFRGGTDGELPLDTPINVGGTLYGTTDGGGSKGLGTIFSLHPATGTETIIYSFQGGSDGFAPLAGVTEAGGMLYGTTGGGGKYSLGTVFSFNIADGTEQVVHAFEGGTDGSGPQASLIKIGSRFYGTTASGGASANCPNYPGFPVGCGTIFWVNPKDGNEKIAHTFQSMDGAHPSANLLSAGSTVYGTTASGGAHCGSDGCGTIFEFTP